MSTNNTILMPIKTDKNLKEEAAELFKSQGLTLTAGVNLLLREFVKTKKLTIWFDDSIEGLEKDEIHNINSLENLPSFLDSIPKG